MELTRQEGRGRPSRSRKDASNKENICPSQGTGSTAAEAARRRSPLPEGFPRSPLQDITHIICPHNIWPTNEDQLTDQVRKKFRKDNSEGSCIATEVESTIQQEVAGQQQCNPSWKGLALCAHVKIGTVKVSQSEETRMEKEDLKLNTNVKVVAITGGANLAQDLCIYRDNVRTDAISLPNCDIEGRQDAKSEEQTKQTGALDAQAHLIQHRKLSAKEHCNNLKQSICNRSMQTIVGKESHTKRLQQPAQSNKKSNLAMLR